VAYLTLALLGPFQATLDGRPAEGLNSDRLRALLAYLAVESGREHPREQVASLLWPERTDQEALSALRNALSKLRGALGDRRSPGDCRAPSPFLLITRTSVQFNQASDHWLDTAEFERMASQDLTGLQRTLRVRDLSGLTEAVKLYRGPFLHGLSVADSPAFDEWMLFKGEEYRRGALSLLEQLTSLHIAHGESAEAVRWARRQLELEPYREEAHRQLMAALALEGERPAALAHYEACRRLLAEELGCEPDDQTQALYAQIRAGTLALSMPPSLGASASPDRRELPVSVGAPPPPRFVAREQELAWLGTLLDRALAGRGGVALIAGEAGSGKTALLDEFARRACLAHGDLIAVRGRCNAHGGAGDPYLPFREILQTLAGDVEGERAAWTLSPEQARRAWEALPAVGAALAEHGPDLIDTFVPGWTLLQRVEGFRAPPAAARPPVPQTPQSSRSSRPCPEGQGPRERTVSEGELGAGQAWQARLRELVRRGQEGTPPAPQADLFAQVTRVLQSVSLRRPLLLAIDDLQWADGGTAALLFHLERRLAGSRILLVCAYRPEALQASPDPKGLPRPLGSVLQELTRQWGDVLIDLDRADGREFVEALVDSEPNRLGAAFRQALYDHTEGNPLFTVELLRSFERDGSLVQDEAGYWIEAAGPDWERWPPQVEAVIAGHLSGLPDEDRALLQAASVQGEQFAAEVAARALGWDEEAAVRRLSGPLRTPHRLVEAVSLERLASSGQRLSCYRFRHALVQASAYRSLDAVERARLHEATGRALERVYGPVGQAEGGQPSTPTPQLARHYEAAGLPLEAARHRLEAGRWATRLVAYDEAIAHLERGLVLLERLAPTTERLHLELALCLALVNPTLLRQGWRAPAYRRALGRLSDLAQHPALKDDPQRLAALAVLALMTTWSADPERGRRVGEQLLGLAHDGDRQSLMLANWVLAHSHWLQGQLVAARERLEQALAIHDPDAGHPLSPVFGADPGVMGCSVRGNLLWLLGYPDQSRTSLRQALARAQAIEQPSSAAFAHLVAGSVYFVLGRDMAAALSHAQALPRLGGAGLEYGPWAQLLAGQGQVEAVCGQARTAPEQAADPGTKAALERGLAQAAEAGSALQALGSGVGQASQLLIQAQMCALAGQTERGLEAMDQAQAWIERTGVRNLQAEVWRMRGELLLADRPDRSGRPVRSSEVDKAEACFRRALEVAQEQQARWLELRAVVSLARLWQAQGRRGEARELLAGIYGWFTEGFDTVDLVEAKGLLAELELE